MKNKLFPFAIFIIIVGFLVFGLNRNPGEVPSPLIGEPAPQFSLPTLVTAEQSQGAQILSTKDMLGKVWLFNVWASWCPTCRAEHPLLVQLSHRKLVDIVGLDYKDNAADAREFLQKLGNPYTVIAVDEAGDAAIDYGVYGVPETFVIDKRGIVRLKYSGQLTSDDMQNKIIPLIIALKEAEN